MTNDSRRKVDKNLIVSTVALFLTVLGQASYTAIVISNDIAVLKQAVTEKTKDRFHKSEAMQHLAVRDQRIAHVEDEYRRLITQLQNIEIGVAKISIATHEQKVTLENIKTKLEELKQ